MPDHWSRFSRSAKSLQCAYQSSILITFKENETQSSIADTPVSNEQMKPSISSESTNQLDFSQFNPYGGYSLYDAWFGQHLINLGDLEMD